jgi:hypothetical protein
LRLDLLAAVNENISRSRVLCEISQAASIRCFLLKRANIKKIPYPVGRELLLNAEFGPNTFRTTKMRSWCCVMVKSWTGVSSRWKLAVVLLCLGPPNVISPTNT